MNKLAVAQTCSNGSIEENLAELKDFVIKASSSGAKLIVFPEECLTQSMMETEKAKLKEPLNKGPLQTQLANYAKENHIWIYVGSFPIVSEENHRYYSSSLLFNDKGELVAFYHKIHMFDAIVEKDKESYQESKHVKPGSDIKVVDTPIGKIGMSICYDLRFPEIYRQQVKMGAQLLCVPASFTYRTGQAHWDVLTRARAIENLCYLLACGNCGTRHNGQRTWGHSRIIDPWGKCIQECEFEPSLLLTEIDMKAQKTIRAQFPVLTHMRQDLKDKV